MVPKIPVIVLAFANEFSEGRFLRHLTSEMKELLRALEPAVQKGRCIIKLIPAATQEEIADVFQDEWYQGRIWIFHYAGHASEDRLWLENEENGNQSFFSLGLAKFLGAQEGLKLVFLNACATEDHGRLLLESGVPAVVATSQKIEDAQAQAFAHAFYGGLAGGASVLESYQEAEGLVLGKWGGQAFRHLEGEESSTRSFFWEDKKEDEADFPWRLTYQEGSNLFIDYWRLFYEVGNQSLGKALGEEDFIGKEIQNYSIKKFLGQGRFGAVYLATHKNLNKDVAIKISHSVKSGYEELKNIIFSGNKGLSSLRHPNVVDFYDAGEEDFDGDKRLYVIMELVSGKRLDKMELGVPHLDDKGLARLGDWALQICDGLNAAHNTQFADASGMPRDGFIHGNLKTRKILFTPDGTPKIIDFLFADIARSHQIEMEVPKSVKEYGKGERLEDTYPPEVISGLQTINKKTDIYSFGTIMIEILLGKKRSELIIEDARHLKELMEARNPNIPDYFSKLVYHAIHPDPTQRISNFAELSSGFLKPKSLFKRISYLVRKKI